MLDYLEIKDLLRLSCVSRSWRFRMEDDMFWASRYVADLGMDNYNRLLATMADPLSSTCGWSVKQHLLWSLVGLVARDNENNVRFNSMRDLWVGILREKKRKALEYVSYQHAQTAAPFTSHVEVVEEPADHTKKPKVSPES